MSKILKKYIYFISYYVASKSGTFGFGNDIYTKNNSVLDETDIESIRKEINDRRNEDFHPIIIGIYLLREEECN